MPFAAVWAALKLVPWKIWAGIALVLALWAYLAYEAHVLRKQGFDEAVAEYKPRLTALRNAIDSWKREIELEKKRRADTIAAYEAKLKQQEIDFEAKLREERELRKKEVADAKSRIKEFVTPEGRALCPALPAGFVLYHNRIAEAANRGERLSPGVPPSRELAGADSGASLDSLSEVWTDNANAYRECRSRLNDVLERWERAAVEYEALIARMTEEKPK